MARFSICIALFITLLSSTFADDPCVFTVPGKGTIDIRSTGNTDGTPKYKDLQQRANGWVYSFNPCEPFAEGGLCSNAAACQVEDTKPDRFLLGTQDTAQWSTGITDKINTVQYQATDAQGTTRTAVITLNCPDDPTEDRVSFNGETPGPRYAFQWTHKCLCWDACKGVGPTPSGGGGGGKLSGGAIFIILLVSLLFAYFVIFLIYNRAVRKHTGLDVIPHRSFWVGVPVYAKDGVVYIFRRATGKGGNYQSV